ncbi:hypothetical protein K469DRAFT_751100 [Zopfia rhizophila CBS 207.26]|uniref:Ankyrin n=1 Tax=Zopfia rhizophila CBS 207.26 TaxID=1314779 RepID=A0A6A6DWT4_9PEZI|nr:hypothetical protein K469DRAFT_751100 [Zopfia rhizophila CBS 207.26]
MIVRACKDYFGIIKIAAIPNEADLAPNWNNFTDGSPRRLGDKMVRNPNGIGTKSREYKDFAQAKERIEDAINFCEGNEITITEEILIDAAENDNGHEIVRLFIDHRGDELRITPQVLNATARSGSGHETIRLLLEKRGDEVNITEEMVKAAAGNKDRGKEIIKLLPDQQRDEVEVTEEVVRAASADQLSIRGAGIMSLLLDRLEDAASIPEEVLRTLPKDWDSKEKIREYIQNEWESWGLRRRNYASEIRPETR